MITRIDALLKKVKIQEEGRGCEDDETYRDYVEDFDGTVYLFQRFCDVWGMRQRLLLLPIEILFIVEKIVILIFFY